jgi:hypothetical protein
VEAKRADRIGRFEDPLNFLRLYGCRAPEFLDLAPEYAAFTGADELLKQQ